jgi:hypothetical protein
MLGAAARSDQRVEVVRPSSSTGAKQSADGRVDGGALPRLPQWEATPQSERDAVGGGITNHNFKVTLEGEAYVLRGGKDTELLGINRRPSTRPRGRRR